MEELPNQILVDKCKEVVGASKEMDQETKDLLGEYFILRNLSHPGIVEHKYFVHVVDEQANKHEYHILMESLNGRNMKEYLELQGRPYSINKVREVGHQLISAISYLHEQNIVHMDLEPQNIMFSEDY